MILRDPELEPPAQKSTGMEPPQRPKPDDWDTRKINTFSTFHGSSNSHLAGLAVGRGRHAHSRSLVLDTPLPAPARPSHGHSRSLVVDMPVRIIHGHSRSLVEICPDTPISSSSGSSGGGSTEGRASERTPRPLSRSSARLSGKDAPLRPLSRSSGSGITISCGGGGEGSAPPPPPRPVPVTPAAGL
ncbi:hypothetical protein FJT64_016622 [Amphibalanus amphitrite]|uniref:Uncharacterized protein n=1 Tax=Amphibalanus amphitrite TaxID=1232801 RepID=A0A6A4XBQ2_AMPAM|nr:hypothetical protein FJT64_016622 [Amphibalanus amphitrite]